MYTYNYVIRVYDYMPVNMIAYNIKLYIHRYYILSLHYFFFFHKLIIKTYMYLHLLKLRYYNIIVYNDDKSITYVQVRFLNGI